MKAIQISLSLIAMLSMLACSGRGASQAVSQGRKAAEVPKEQLQACKLNLKNLGSAQELHKHQKGSYTTSPQALSKDDLRDSGLTSLPTCPVAGAAYSQKNRDREFTIHCGGDHSAAEVPEGFPQYDSIKGLMERP